MGLFGRKKNWNYHGTHKVTRTQFDPDGYDVDGFDKDGFDKRGSHCNGTAFNNDGFDKDGYNKHGYNKDGFNRSGYNKDGFDIKGFDKTGYNINGYNKHGYNKNGFNRSGYNKDGFDKDGFDKRGSHCNGTAFNNDGFDKRGFNQEGIHRITKTKFDESGFDKRGFNQEGWDGDGYDKYNFNQEGIHRITKTKFDESGFDKYGVGKDGFDRNTHKQFELTSKFSKITSSFNSEFDAFVTLAYNEPTKIRSKLFFSHDEKTGIYSKEFELFSNKNVVHFHIEKTGKQFDTNWNKPKDTGRLQGDNFESGYTLIVNFNKNDSKLKSILIEKLGKLSFGSLPSQYTLNCHLDDDFPTDERAKELLQKVVGLFSSENNTES